MLELLNSLNTNLNQVFYLQFVSSWVMFTVIWYCQILHYPTFAWVEKEAFTEFVNFHGQRISLIVIPFMFLELITASILMLYAVDKYILIFIITLLLWLSTATLQGPTHGKLAKARDEKLIQFLVKTNWIRTLLWTTKTILLTIILFKGEQI